MSPEPPRAEPRFEGDAEASTPGAPAPASKLGLKHVASQGLHLYQSFDKVDRSGGGGIGFATVVKLTGWAGLIAVLAALVVKLKSIEQQLDPVSHGVAELRAELEAARKTVHQEAEASQNGLRSLDADAAALHKALRDARELQSRTGAALGSSQHEVEALGEQLRADTDGARALTASAAHLTSSLADYDKQVADSRSALDAAISKNQGSLTELGTNLAGVHERVQTLDASIAALQLEPTRASLAQVQNNARALSEGLQSALDHVHQLDQLVQERIAEESAARKARASASPSAPRTSDSASTAARHAAPMGAADKQP